MLQSLGLIGVVWDITCLIFCNHSRRLIKIIPTRSYYISEKKPWWHLILDEADLPALYRGAALFMFPSLYEGFGLPVLEAMASGVPVIASSSGSLPEVVGNAGLLVNPLQTEEITQAMHRLLSDSQLREQLIQLGLERVRHFSWTSSALKTLNVYKSVSGWKVSLYLHYLIITILKITEFIIL